MIPIYSTTVLYNNYRNKSSQITRMHHKAERRKFDKLNTDEVYWSSNYSAENFLMYGTTISYAVSYVTCTVHHTAS